MFARKCFTMDGRVVAMHGRRRLVLMGLIWGRCGRGANDLQNNDEAGAWAGRTEKGEREWRGRRMAGDVGNAFRGERALTRILAPLARELYIGMARGM